MVPDIKSGQVQMIKFEKTWQIPEWPCPACNGGVLEEDAILLIESNQSKKEHANPSWEASWISGSASGTLRCNRKSCKEAVNFVGDYSVTEDHYFDEEAGPHVYYGEVVTPQYFYPPIPLFKIELAYPKEIREELAKAFGLFWCEKSSCANKIRATVEKLLTGLKVPRFSKKKAFLSLHHRIGKLGPKLENERKALMALKIIGNPGSHGQDVHYMDLVNAFEILEHTLKKIFLKEEKRIGKVVRHYLKKNK